MCVTEWDHWNVSHRNPLRLLDLSSSALPNSRRKKKERKNAYRAPLKSVYREDLKKKKERETKKTHEIFVLKENSGSENLERRSRHYSSEKNDHKIRLKRGWELGLGFWK